MKYDDILLSGRFVVLDIELLQEDINALFYCVCKNFLCFNAEVLVSRKINHTPVLAIKTADKTLKVVNAYKYLGVWMQAVSTGTSM